MSVPVVYLGSAGEFPAVPLPFFLERVSAGFPSPAQDYVERALDLNELCIKQPAATFFVRAQGDSMIEAGIFTDDVLVVDRSLTARSGDVVIARFFGELTVKQLQLGPPPRLVPCNQRLRPIHVPPDADLEVIGVVTHVIHSLRR
jgi:DNA polymerase V